MRWFLWWIPVWAIACSTPPMYSEQQSLGDEGWDFRDTAYFQTEVTDTVNHYNFYLLVRHRGDYPYRNFFVFIRNYHPELGYSIDSVECMLADGEGRWLGKGLGDVLDHKVLYKFRRRFPTGGTYRFGITHGMRDTVVPALTNIGLSIEPEEG